MLNKNTEDPLRVMMLSQRLPPINCTGAPLQAWHLSKALLDRGHEVKITTTRPIGRTSRPQYGEGVSVHELAYLNLPGTASITRFARAARVSFPTARWDVIHGHALSPMVLGAAFNKTRESAPFLVKPSIGGDHAEGEIRQIRASTAYPIFRKALHKIDLFAVLDDLIEEDLRAVGIPAERMHRVDNGIDLKTYYPATVGVKSELRRKFGLGVGTRVLLFCGQLSQRKGIDELLAAWSVELAKEHGAVLAVCGDGPLRPAVESAAAANSGHLVYLGPVADSSEVIRMADVLVLPSHCESFGNVIIEAFASGVPVAATACGIAPRVLADSRCGWLISRPSRKPIGTALRSVFANAHLWAQMAETCKEVAEQFSMERRAAEYTEIYRQLVGRQE